MIWTCFQTRFRLNGSSGGTGKTERICLDLPVLPAGANHLKGKTKSSYVACTQNHMLASHLWAQLNGIPFKNASRYQKTKKQVLMETEISAQHVTDHKGNWCFISRVTKRPSKLNRTKARKHSMLPNSKIVLFWGALRRTPLEFSDSNIKHFYPGPPFPQESKKHMSTTVNSLLATTFQDVLKIIPCVFVFFVGHIPFSMCSFWVIFNIQRLLETRWKQNECQNAQALHWQNVFHSILRFTYTHPMLTLRHAQAKKMWVGKRALLWLHLSVPPATREDDHMAIWYCMDVQDRCFAGLRDVCLFLSTCLQIYF